MIDDDLHQLLKGLKLRRLLEIIERELAVAEEQGPSYTEWLKRLLRQEYTAQQDRFLEYRVQRAKLPERWALETFPWEQQPKIERRVIEQLAELDFVPRGSNIVFVGPTGVGKTGLASAILLKALHQGYRGFSSKRRSSSTRCTRRSPIEVRESSWIASFASTSY